MRSSTESAHPRRLESQRQTPRGVSERQAATFFKVRRRHPSELEKGHACGRQRATLSLEKFSCDGIMGYTQAPSCRLMSYAQAPSCRLMSYAQAPSCRLYGVDCD